MCNKVDLPDPDLPIIAISEPCGIDMFTFFKALHSEPVPILYVFETFSITILIL